MSSFLDLAFKTFGRDSVSKALSISKNSISYYDTMDRGKNDLVHIFKVNSHVYNYYYDVNIITRRDSIVSYYCECDTFSKSHSCKHVAACLLNYGDMILESAHTDLDISNNILNIFNNGTHGVKEAVNLSLELNFNDKVPTFKLFIGINKMYMINRESKFESFMDAFNNNESYTFGVNFTYDPSIHYIKNCDVQLLNYLFGYIKNRGYYYRYNPFELSDRELESLFIKLDGIRFSIVGIGSINGVKESIPTGFSLNTSGDNYILSIDNIDKYIFVDKHYKYCVFNSILYVLPDNYSTLINSMYDNGLDSLVIDKNHVEVFKNGLLQNIKKDISISSDIDDFVISDEVIPNIYFDLNKDMIECKIEFNYGDNVVNFFDSDSVVVRDVSYENSVIDDICSYGFSIDNKRILLIDIDDIGDFLERGIHLLSEKYSIFTSKKMDDVSILKKSNIKSNFSIGTLDKVFASLKKKKKYYKLKNGNIIDLTNNKEINELNDLFNDLELSSRNIDGDIVIPKYRALYIDSLKKNKYKSINTDNSFDLFISNFNKFKDISIDFGNDNKILRDYQKVGVKWLYTLYKCDLGGILADEMGLGKSLQTICFIKQLLLEKPDSKIMIVCPTSLVYNWKKEFDKFGSELKYATVFDNKSKRLEVIKDFDKYNIFITSYGLIRNDNDEYEDKYFDVCIIDEAQTIKNYQAGMTKEIKKIKARTKIALTGTPLENSVLELWSIFDFIMPGYLGSIHKFKDKYGIHDVDSESLDKLSNLNYKIKPFILRRKKCDVITDLPDKIENNIYLDLPSSQKKVYLSVLKDSEREFREILATEGIGKARFKVLQLLMKLRQVCVDPNILFEDYKGDSIKMEKLLEVVHGYVKEGHKILIFSSFKMVIDRVKSLFDDNNISSYMIAGDVKSKTRMELVDKFNNDSTNCFLITLKSGGTGLNLVGADVVIHLDIWWNPQVENQATDRAHRIGQTKKVSVVKLITRGTIEEKIIELQNKKKVLSDNLIEGKETSVLNSLNEEEIKNLLSYSENE